MGSTIRFLPFGGTWETLGAERFRGIAPAGIEASSDDWGPAGLSFLLAAQEAVERPDLTPFTPIEYEEDGLLCWSGFVWQRPSEENAYSVTCRGWQYHLDDDLLNRVYVHTTLSEYRDQRSFSGSPLTNFTVAGKVQNDDGQILIGWANGDVIPANGAVGVTLDLGDSTAKRIVMTWDSTNNDANTTCYIRTTAGESAIPGGAFDDFASFALNTGASGTTSGTATTARRYVHVLLFNATGGTYGADVHLKIKTLQIFRDAAYESGNASILKASTVVEDALLAKATKLNPATSLIEKSNFSIPEYRTNGYETPRAMMDAVNTYELWQLRIAGEDLKTLQYRTRPANPLFEVGGWSGVRFSDSSMTGEDIYNKVIVFGQGADGSFVGVTRTQEGLFVDRRGGHRTRVIEARRGIGMAEANQLGDLFLAEHKTAAFAGKIEGAGECVRQILGGGPVPPQAMLRHVGEKIRLSKRLDPDTGAIGRDGRIAAVTFRPEGRRLSIAIDDKRNDFERLLNRMLVTAMRPTRRRGLG